MKAPNMKPMMTIWTRGSSLIVVNIWLIVFIAPDCFMVFMIRMAPRMTQIVSRDVSIPLMVCATTVMKGIFHTVTQMMNVIAHARGRARLAGQFRPAMTITVTMIGIKAIIAYIDKYSFSAPAASPRIGPTGTEQVLIPARPPFSDGQEFLNKSDHPKNGP